jgi:hypothetical protein
MAVAGALLLATACTSSSSVAPNSPAQQVFVTGSEVEVFPLPAPGSDDAATTSFGSFQDGHRSGFDAAGNLYVTDAEAGTISVFYPSAYAAGATGNAAPALVLGSSFGAPSGVAFDSQGYMYVTNLEGEVLLFAPIAIPSTPPVSPVRPTPYATLSGTNTTFDQPNGIAVDAAGNVYVANEYAADVLIFSRSDLASAYAAATTTANFSTPSTFAPGPSDHAAPRAASLGTSPTLNVAPSTTITGFSNVHSLTRDAAGNLYVTDQGAPAVDIFTAAQTATGQGIIKSLPQAIIPGGTTTTMEYPNGIATDANGNIYVADTGLGEILVFPPVTSAGVQNVAPTATITVTTSRFHDVTIH